jgi:hypothetical protein
MQVMELYWFTNRVSLQLEVEVGPSVCDDFSDIFAYRLNIYY